MDLERPIPFITLGDTSCEDGNPHAFCISNEAKEYLQNISGPVAVVSIAGLYRTGKSYLLNQLLGRRDADSMFHVGGTVNACTKGIWIWGKPIKDIRSEEQPQQEDMTVVFLDTEGLGSTQRSSTQDSRLFALALLLSSAFLYNSRGVIDSNAIKDLSLVVNLTKYIQLSVDKSTAEQSADDLADVFPTFLWIVRDFTLQLQENGKAITSTEYLEAALRVQNDSTENEETQSKNHICSVLRSFFPNRDCVTMVRPINDESLLRDLPNQPYESLREEFREQLEALRTSLLHTLQPKQLMNNVLNGSMLLSLAESYVHAFNVGKAPVISTSWDRVLDNECRQVFERLQLEMKHHIEAKLDDRLSHDAKPMEVDQIQHAVLSAFNETKTRLRQATIAEHSVLHPYETRLFDATVQLLTDYFQKNEELSKTYCQDCIQTLYGPIQTELEAYGKRRSTDGSKAEIDEMRQQLLYHQSSVSTLIEQYNAKAIGPLKARVLTDFLSQKLIQGLVDWGTVVSMLYRQEHSSIQKSINRSKQSVSAMQGKSKAIQDILSHQKESYERALQHAKERLVDERRALRDEIVHKQNEVDRVNQQIEKMRVVHAESLERIEKQVEQASSQVERLESKTTAERDRREADVQCVSRELLESERSFHSEEKHLIQSHQQTLLKVVELERQLGDQNAQHMKDCFKLEQQSSLTIENLQTSHQEKYQAMKSQILQEIRSLKMEQDASLSALKIQLNEKKAHESALQEKMRMFSNRKASSAAAAASRPSKTGASSSSKSKKDCAIQ